MSEQFLEGASRPLPALQDTDVAARLGVSVSTLRGWRRKSPPWGPRFMKIGRAVRYRPEDVEAYMREVSVETSRVGGSQ